MTQLATKRTRRAKALNTSNRQSAKGRSKPTYKSEVFEALHQSASALHRVGALDEQTMRNFDVACIQQPSNWNKTKVRQLRERYRMSQPVFAAHLNSTLSTVAQWESGAKHPSNIAAKLLHILDKHGPQILR